MLSIVTLGLAYVFDLYLNPFIIIPITYFHLLDIEVFLHDLVYFSFIIIIILE